MPPPFSADATVTRSKGQISTTLGGEVVILSVDDGVYYGLSEVGAHVWSLIEAPRRVTELIDAVTAAYEVTREQAADDLAALLSEMLERGLVVLSNGHDR